MKDRYDLIVVGAGPGGSLAAYTGAQAGLDVLLVEKKNIIGSEVRCAEGVSLGGLSQFLEPSPNWVAARLSGASLYSPNGTRVDLHFPGEGYILERVIFDREMARRAAAAGADILLGSYAEDLRFNGRSMAGVTVRQEKYRRDIESNVVIAADGVESRLARLAGIDTTSSLHNMESCYQYGLVSDGFDLDRVELFWGAEVAPGGYAWAFSKGDNLANVGLGITGEHARRKSAREYLDDFVASRYPEAQTVYRFGGGVPLGRTPRRIVAPGFMVVGDAARQVNPISGGGLINAMIAGRLAGETAVKAFEAGDFSGRFLGEYQKRWDEKIGKSLRRFYRLKEVICRLSDDSLNDIARFLNGLKPEERTMLQAFKVALRDHPKLLLELRHLF
jgi:digeranylgeranylglycerophospholipid reductase